MSRSRVSTLAALSALASSVPTATRPVCPHCGSPVEPDMDSQFLHAMGKCVVRTHEPNRAERFLASRMDTVHRARRDAEIARLSELSRNPELADARREKAAAKRQRKASVAASRSSQGANER